MYYTMRSKFNLHWRAVESVDCILLCTIYLEWEESMCQSIIIEIFYYSRPLGVTHTDTMVCKVLKDKRHQYGLQTDIFQEK